MMTLLLYKYPKWPGLKGDRLLIDSGEFEFALQDAIDQISEARERANRDSHFKWPAQQAQYKTLLAIEERLTRPDLTQHETVAWNHATRQWSTHELEQESKRWRTALEKWFRKNESSIMRPLLVALGHEEKVDEELAEASFSAAPEAYLPDTLLGNNLAWLIYKHKFVAVTCPSCLSRYVRQQCFIEEWQSSEVDWYYTGERLLCPSGHELHAHCTTITETFPISRS